MLYTALSAYTNNPFNVAINSASVERKSYIIQKVVDDFPKQDVIVYSAMTDKALLHRRGAMTKDNTNL
jgi:hypothetical protein